MDSEDYESATYDAVAVPSLKTSPKRKRTSKQCITAEEKARIRAFKNRISAQNSRNKQKLHIQELESENKQMKDRITALEAENKALAEKLNLVLNLLESGSTLSVNSCGTSSGMSPVNSPITTDPPITSNPTLTIDTATPPLASNVNIASPFVMIQANQPDSDHFFDFLDSVSTNQQQHSLVDIKSSSVDDSSDDRSNVARFIPTEEQKEQFDQLFFNDDLFNDCSKDTSTIQSTPFSFASPSFSSYSSICTSTSLPSLFSQQPTPTKSKYVTSNTNSVVCQFGLESDPAVITDKTRQQFSPLTRKLPNLEKIHNEYVADLTLIPCDPLISLIQCIHGVCQIKLQTQIVDYLNLIQSHPYFLSWGLRKEGEMKRENGENGLICDDGYVAGKRKKMREFEARFPISYAMLQRSHCV